jgi:hypothetical protein
MQISTTGFSAYFFHLRDIETLKWTTGHQNARNKVIISAFSELTLWPVQDF